MGGLQLWVFPNGSKLWRLAYHFYGKQKLIALGRYPEVSLLDARIGREKARALLKEGRDPSAVRQLERIEAASTGDSFNVVANEYVAKLRREGRSDATMTKVEWLLEFARPMLGSLSVREIRPVEVLAVLRKVEARGRYDTARRSVTYAPTEDGVAMQPVIRALVEWGNRRLKQADEARAENGAGYPAKALMELDQKR